MTVCYANKSKRSKKPWIPPPAKSSKGGSSKKKKWSPTKSWNSSVRHENTSRGGCDVWPGKCFHEHAHGAGFLRRNSELQRLLLFKQHRYQALLQEQSLTRRALTKLEELNSELECRNSLLEQNVNVLSERCQLLEAAVAAVTKNSAVKDELKLPGKSMENVAASSPTTSSNSTPPGKKVSLPQMTLDLSASSSDSSLRRILARLKCKSVGIQTEPWENNGRRPGKSDATLSRRLKQSERARQEAQARLRKFEHANGKLKQEVGKLKNLARKMGLKLAEKEENASMENSGGHSRDEEHENQSLLAKIDELERKLQHVKAAGTSGLEEESNVVKRLKQENKQLQMKLETIRDAYNKLFGNFA